MTRPLPPLATCSYNEYTPNMGTAVRTSRGIPRWFPHQPVGEWWNVAPDRSMLNIADQAQYRTAYEAKLDHLGPDQARADLLHLADLLTDQNGHPPHTLVLLCYEKVNRPGNWCHRTMLANWLAQNLSVTVPELGAHNHDYGADTPSLF